MWTTFLLGHYVPLSWMTLGLDYVIWGMNPAGYHLTSLLLHCADAVLAYFLARRILRLTGVVGQEVDGAAVAIPAGFAALLFAVHPLRAESVVWVTERRDVLSGLFYLSSLLLNLRDVERPTAKRLSYWLALVAFAAALLSKGSAVTLPPVLLILNVYPLRRLGGDAWLGLCAIGVPSPGQPLPLDWMLRSLHRWFVAALEPFGVTPSVGRVEGAWCPGFSDIASGGRKLAGLGFRVPRDGVVMRGVMAVRPMSEADLDVLVQCHRLIGVEVRGETATSLAEASGRPSLDVPTVIEATRHVRT